jgi:hypothetical protein
MTDIVHFVNQKKLALTWISKLDKYKTIIVVAFIWLFCVSCGILRIVVKFRYIETVFVAIIFVLFLLPIALQIMILVFAKMRRKNIQLVNRVVEYNHRDQNSEEALQTVSVPNKTSKTVGLIIAVYIVS